MPEWQERPDGRWIYEMPDKSQLGAVFPQRGGGWVIMTHDYDEPNHYEYLGVAKLAIEVMFPLEVDQ